MICTLYTTSKQGRLESIGTPDLYAMFYNANESLSYNETSSNDTRVRLINMSGYSKTGPLLEGRLEIRPRGETEWGTICNEVSDAEHTLLFTTN